MPAGSVVFYPGTLWHGGGENRSSSARLAVTCQYCEPWLRTQENFFLSLSKDTVRVDPALQAEEVERHRRLNKLGAHNIVQAHRAGEIATDHSPRLLVAMILGGVMSGVSEALADTPPWPLEQTQTHVWSFVERAVGIGRP